MKHLIRTTTRLILPLLFILVSYTHGTATEIDEPAVFVEAFNAYQQKDYLLTIEKCDQLNQTFPDSPLRDVTLLLIARASLRSGNNERAAKSAAMFSTEFPESALKTSIEDELKVLANRYQKGDALGVDKTLQLAASKVRSDTLARERAAKLKLEMELAAKARAEQERLARIKAEEERREKERLQAEEIARSSINATITLVGTAEPVPVGSNGNIPIEISNTGKNNENFLLTIAAAKEYNAILVRANRPDEKITQLQLASGETFKGSIAFRMPAEMIDGHRSIVMVKAVSTRFNDISFQKETHLISSAPLVRVVAKLVKRNITPAEKLSYNVVILNAGSLPAKDLTVRLQLPSQIDFQGAPDSSLKQEANGTIVFKVDQIDIGNLKEINMDVKTREGIGVGQELRGRLEISNGNLQRKDSFTTRSSTVIQTN